MEPKGVANDKLFEQVGSVQLLSLCYQAKQRVDIKPSLGVAEIYTTYPAAGQAAGGENVSPILTLVTFSRAKKDT